MSTSRPSTGSVTLEDVREAADRLKGVAHRTPVLRSRTLDRLAGAETYLKCENFQRVGAFKFRGAYNAISQLPPEKLHAASPPTPPATTPRPSRWRHVNWAAARSS